MPWRLFIDVSIRAGQPGKVDDGAAAAAGPFALFMGLHWLGQCQRLMPQVSGNVL